MASIAGTAHAPRTGDASTHRVPEGKKGMNYDLIPHNPLGTVPDELPDDNPGLYRLIIAKRAIIAGYEAGENDPEACITDLLADLRHLCDVLGLDFADLDEGAYGHYVEERKQFRFPGRKIPVKQVVLERAEGPVALCVTKKFPSFEEATEWLRTQAYSFPPKGGGYHKVIAEVTFADRQFLRFRMDCNQWEDPDVEKAMVKHVAWFAGREENPWCGQEMYRQHLAEHGEKVVKFYAALFDRYLAGTS